MLGTPFAEHLESLTEDERQVLELLAAGRTRKEIAVELGIAEETVLTHTLTILAKLAGPPRSWTHHRLLSPHRRLSPSRFSGPRMFRDTSVGTFTEKTAPRSFTDARDFGRTGSPRRTASRRSNGEVGEGPGWQWTRPLPTRQSIPRRCHRGGRMERLDARGPLPTPNCRPCGQSWFGREPTPVA